MKNLIVLLLLFITTPISHAETIEKANERRVIQMREGPEHVIWAVQLSDLHFSVHHPDRASDFRRIVGPALSMINPSLVLITGDLTGFFQSFSDSSVNLFTNFEFEFILLVFFCSRINVCENGIR